MSEFSFAIRPALQKDIPQVFAMLRELAVFGKLEDQLCASESEMHEALFVGHRAEALVAELSGHAEGSGRLIGYAIYFENFSTFLCRRGIYLEDLYVRPDFRKRGVGKTLLRRLANLAVERDCGRMEWSVLNWNQHAIDVYRTIGGDVLPDWRIVRMQRDAIKRLAEASS